MRYWTYSHFRSRAGSVQLQRTFRYLHFLSASGISGTGCLLSCNIRNTPRTSAVPPYPVWKNPDTFWYFLHLPGLFPVLRIIWEGDLIDSQILRIMLYQLICQYIIISIFEIDPVGWLLIQLIRIPVNLWLRNQEIINSLDGAAVDLIPVNQLLNPVFQLHTSGILDKTPCS